MKTTSVKIFQVNLSYNIEAEDSMAALDKIMCCSPFKPQAVSVESIETCDDDDD